MQALQKNATIMPQTCLSQRKNTLTTSQTNLTNLQQILTDQTSSQQKTFLQKKRNPTLCISPQDPSVILNIYDTQNMLVNFQQEHQQSLSIRATQDAKQIDELCQATKNDSQINEGIQSTIDKLLNSLNKNTDNTSSMAQPATNLPQYIPFDANDQKLLENIDKKNKIRIRQIQRLKSDPAYQGMDYIQNLFYQFYGNTGDFQ